MKFYFKRNVFHPVIKVGNEPVKWERFKISNGLLATDDPDVIKAVDKVVKASEKTKAHLELTEAEYKSAKKNAQQTRRPSVTFPPSMIARAESRTPGRSRGSLSALLGKRESAAGQSNPAKAEPVPPPKVERQRRTRAVDSPVVAEAPEIPPPPSAEAP